MSRREQSQQYWDAYHHSLAPPPGSAARNLARIRERLDRESIDGEGEGEDEAEPERAAPRRAAAGIVVLGKSAAASVAIATATLLSIKLAVVGWTQLSSPPEPSAPTAEPTTAAQAPRAPSEAAPVSADPVAVPPSVVDAPATTDASVATPKPARPNAARARTNGGTTADRLRAEVLLMDRARAAMERDDNRALLELVDEHARRFPHGALTEERQAWRAVAACRLGHANAASTAAEFLRAHGRSAQAAKVRRACDGLPFDSVTD